MRKLFASIIVLSGLSACAGTSGGYREPYPPMLGEEGSCTKQGIYVPCNGGWGVGNLGWNGAGAHPYGRPGVSVVIQGSTGRRCGWPYC